MATRDWRGEKDRAFEWLERAFAQDDDGLIHARFDPLLRNLHGDRRFDALLEKLNVPVD